MKNLIIPSLLIAGFLSIYSTSDKSANYQNPEENQKPVQIKTVTATVKNATRLFGLRDDLTSVIELIPAGSVVSVLDSDSTYYRVNFNDNEGYILKKHALIDKAPTTFSQMQSPKPVPDVQPIQVQTDSRYDDLVNKYGTSMADRLYAGKIWKGMNSDMVKDSWGTAEKINRVVSGNVIKEEWIYRSTWLYFENNILKDWGPVKQ
jgi:hypothetical protein